MEGHGGMRAADADRQAVVDRLQRAYAARTYGELDVLLADLPASAAVGRQAATSPVPEPDRRAGVASWLALVWLPYLGVNAIALAVWAVPSVLAGKVLYFWPGWVAGPWGALLLLTTVAGRRAGAPGGPGRHRRLNGRFCPIRRTEAAPVWRRPVSGVDFLIGAQRPLRHVHPALRWNSEPRLARASDLGRWPV
ncbi:DUF1707 SHOCT-like domain-containing protein [Micromonospora sp. DT233]|uniref:DUF1707 SHOCT-like domain-containing protein n=1 Tax=Micromonospora sp. DT233 TaxID=3393432 RepID=UPI003CECFBAD